MPHPESDRLRHAMERCVSRAARWSGVVYRSASPRYANKDDLLTGVGSKTAGGRWNPPKSFPTVYSSLDPHTALDEVLAHFRYYGFPIESAMPRVTVSVRVPAAPHEGQAPNHCSALAPQSAQTNAVFAFATTPRPAPERAQQAPQEAGS